MQNNSLWVGVGVVVLVVIAVIAFMRMGTPTDQSAATAESQPSESSLRALIASGALQKCTFSSDMQNATSEGTVYIAGGKVRGDFTATGGGQTQTGHFIMADNTTYVWADGMSQGFKTSLGTSSAQQQIDPDAPGNYNCEAWVPDQTLFALPATITFTDLGSIPGMQQ